MAAVHYSLDDFVHDMQELLAAQPDQARLFDRGSVFLERLIQNPESIPEEFRRPPVNGRRAGGGSFALRRSPGLLVTSVIWGPGNHIGPHDHHTWGMIGVLGNGIQEKRFRRVDDRTSEQFATLVEDRTAFMRSGEISLLIPDEDEIHQLDNFSDRPTVEIHVYGAELGDLDRCRYDERTGEIKRYRSGKFDNC
jgi:3-mercaptopropionate dioxygenase